MKKQIISAVLVICMLLTCIVAADYSASAANSEIKSTAASYNLADTVDDGVILQAWNWSYKNIEAKLETLASLGYTTIQVSPPNTIKAETAGVKVYGRADNAWWMFYQPAGFQLNQQPNNSLGVKSELKSLCDKAHSLGMKIIADAVINHLGTNGDESPAMLSNKNTIEHVTPMAWTYAKDIMEANAFHNPFFQMQYKEDPNRYSFEESVYDMTQGSTSNLPDLDTSKPVVQQAILNYFKECIDVGIDGFRIDAAKHIENPDDGKYASNFWPVVVGGANDYAKKTLNKDMFYYGEILNSCGVNRKYSSYLKYFEITDSSTYYGIFDAAAGNASSFRSGYSNGMTKKNAITWAESHDIYMDAVRDNAIQSVNIINKRWALAASRDNTCMYFARPTNAYTTTLGDADVTAWSNKEVGAINHFHNAMAGEGEYISSSGKFAYNERGKEGIIIVNCGASNNAASVNIPVHTLAAGTYEDKITGNKFTCSGGKLTGQMGSTGIVVIYPESNPKVYTSEASGKYYTSTLALTLSSKNVDNATYEYNGGAPVPFTNGQKVTIGTAADTKGATYRVTIKGYVGGQVACTETYTYTKSEKPTAYQITFNPASKWTGSTFYCHYWNNASQAGSTWPGDPMTPNGDGTYSITVSSEYDRVLFDTGLNGKQTLDLTIDDSMTFTLTGKTSTNAGGTTCYEVSSTSSGNTDPTYYPGQNQPATTEPTTATTPITTTAPPAFEKGDVNRDKAVNISDVTCIQKYLVLLEVFDNEQIALADFNNSGTVNIKDATAIQYSLLTK